MLDFKVFENQKPNKDLTNILKDFKYHDERLSEKNKELNPLEWTKLMNTYKITAEEFVFIIKFKSSIALSIFIIPFPIG